MNKSCEFEARRAVLRQNFRHALDMNIFHYEILVSYHRQILSLLYFSSFGRQLFYVTYYVSSPEIR